VIIIYCDCLIQDDSLAPDDLEVSMQAIWCLSNWAVEGNEKQVGYIVDQGGFAAMLQ